MLTFHTRMWFWKCATDIGVLKLIWMSLMLFSFGCLGFPNQTWIDPDILCKWQARACAHVLTQIQKWIKDSEIKHPMASFNWLCLEFFHLMFILRAKLCILFCNQLAFNLFGTLSLLPSAHRWVIAAAQHPSKRGVSQLRGHYLHLYSAAIFMWARGRTYPQLTRSDRQHRVVPRSGRSEVMLQTLGDYRCAESRYQTCDGPGGRYLEAMEHFLGVLLNKGE